MIKKINDWPTTRSYPRTMDEAFPNSAERAEWFYPPRKEWTWGEIVMLIVGAVVWIVLAYYFAKD